MTDPTRSTLVLRIQIALLAQETNSHLLDGQCRAHPEAVEDFQSFTSSATTHSPVGADVRTELNWGHLYFDILGTA